jgi:hypothetical protein
MTMTVRGTLSRDKRGLPVEGLRPLQACDAQIFSPGLCGAQGS